MDHTQVRGSILRRRYERLASGSTGVVLVGISGIDASGKGFITERLADALRRDRVNVAVINIDSWLNLPHVRFGGPNKGRYFYDNALRLDDMFEQLVLPLRAMRSVEVEADHAAETATEFHRHLYSFSDIDVILLEGIFLFRPTYLAHFDLRIWIECSFQTALNRAIARSQEGLDAQATIEAYRTIYFPAQRIHFVEDDPKSAADIIIDNNANR